MDSARELKLLIDEKRGAIDVFTTWLPRTAVVLAFGFIGVTKFTDPQGEWSKIFQQIGFGQWFRYFTGAVQIAGSVMMLTPWTRTIGAAMLACTRIGAMLVDVFIARAVGFALAPLVLLCIVIATWFAGRE